MMPMADFTQMYRNDRNVDTPLNDIGTDTTNRTHGGRNSHDENTVDDAHTLDDSGYLDPHRISGREEAEGEEKGRSKSFLESIFSVMKKKRNKIGHHFDPENKGKALLNYRFGSQGMDLTVYYPNFHGTDMAAYNVKTVGVKNSANSAQQRMHHAYPQHELSSLDDNMQISLVNKEEHGLSSSNEEFVHASLEHGVMTDNGAQYSNKNDTEAQVVKSRPTKRPFNRHDKYIIVLMRVNLRAITNSFSQFLKAAYPPTHYIRRVPQRKVHLFTICQLLQLIILCAFGFVPYPYIEMMFPIICFLFLPIRHLVIPKLIDYKYLDALDGRH
uniref:Bicarbonate transporter-like transmembrane domain-containing protein n=1 Tax=Romanomermis culicivorax TaxID=13658 RepID=A0A915K627_ROMCU